MTDNSLRSVLLGLACLLVIPGTSALASEAWDETGQQTQSKSPEPKSAEQSQEQAVTEAQQKAVEESALRSFAGLNFGAAIALSSPLRTDFVNDAEVVNGIVRVKDRDDARARVLLEAHFFFTPENCRLLFFKVKKEKHLCGYGPFMALQPSGDDSDLIDAVGAGMMWGYRNALDVASSWNIGLGFMADVNAKKLGDGIRKNEPLPEGETTIRFYNRTAWSALLLFSFSF